MSLTKMVSIADEALPIIGAMGWEDNGKVVGRLTCGQLDRALYVKVNQALDALGGKWNRKQGGHVFPVDPRPQIQALLDTGQVEVKRDGYFPTPRLIGLEMAEMAWLVPGMRVLEPSAGTGELAAAIIEAEPAALLWVAEKDPQHQRVLKDKGLGLLAEGDYDFLTYDVGLWPRIIQNPPFEEGQDVDHVRRAYECLEFGGVLVSIMGESPFFRDDSKGRLFRQWLNRQDCQVIDLEQGVFKESGTGVKAKLVVIHKSPMGRGDLQMRLL